MLLLLAAPVGIVDVKEEDFLVEKGVRKQLI